MIVLKENEWAEKMIEKCELGKKPSETLTRVAKYYFSQGYSKSKTRESLEKFILQCSPGASLLKWDNSIEHALKNAQKWEAIYIESVDITKPEMERIEALQGRQIKRLAFTLLCIAKYHMIVNPDSNWWVNQKDNEIMSMANINTSVRRQCFMYSDLREAGLIEFARGVDNTSVRVCFAEDGDVALSVTDFRNLGYQYLMYHSEPYFQCANCGIVTKYENPDNKNSRWKQKYCKSCAVEVAIKQRVNSAMKLQKKI